MSSGLHRHTPRDDTQEPRQQGYGYAHALRQQVQALRSRLQRENQLMLKQCGEHRKARIQTLMQELHEQLINDFQHGFQQAEQARAAARQASCADRSAQVAESLRQSQELRQNLANAERSGRAAGALERAGRLAELREQTQALLSAARMQSLRNRSAAEASAENDRQRRASFMQAMREQVTAMADAFQAEHQAHCAASQSERSTILGGIYDFVASITGRPRPTSTPTGAEDAPRQAESPPAPPPSSSSSATTQPLPPEPDAEAATPPPPKPPTSNKRARAGRHKARS